MGKPEGFERTPKLPYVAVIPVDPGLAVPKMGRMSFDAHLSANPKAIVLIGYATGGTPESLNPQIKRATKLGVPVFILSSNYGSDRGITKVEYGPNVKARETGAIPLRDVNVNHVQDVVKAIQDASREELEGEDLRDAIIAKFGTVARMDEGILEEWSSEADFMQHVGKTVTVFDTDTGKKVLTGKVVEYSERLGSAGIDAKFRAGESLQTAQSAGIPFPEDSVEFKQKMTKYRFRIEE